MQCITDLNELKLFRTVSSFTSTSFCLVAFSLLSAFLSSKPFEINYMHCEIIDRYLNVFFVEIQLETENLVFFGRCTCYRSPLNGLKSSLVALNIIEWISEWMNEWMISFTIKVEVMSRVGAQHNKTFRGWHTNERYKGTFNYYVITKYPKFGSPSPLVCTCSILVAIFGVQYLFSWGQRSF